MFLSKNLSKTHINIEPPIIEQHLEYSKTREYIAGFGRERRFEAIGTVLVF